MLLLLLACARPLPDARPYAPPVTVAFRPEAEREVAGRRVRPDAGLRAAAEEIASVATRPDARLTPTAVRHALARAGYPGDAHVAVADGGDTLPEALTALLPTGEVADVGVAFRDRPEGGRRWWLFWATRRVEMDPVPRDLALDAGLALRVDGAADPRLWIGHPDGRAEELRILDGEARWVDRFHVPGEYRLEVVDRDRIELLFSVWVDQPVPPPAPLPGPAPAPDPAAAAEVLYAELDGLRARAGLPTVRRFPAFEAVAREHARCLDAVGVLAHAHPSCPGVPAVAARGWWPRAKHHEDVGAADTAAELWERVIDSPAHRANLLCASCTHASVGVVAGSGHPLVAVIELLEFPDGEPAPVVRAR